MMKKRSIFILSIFFTFRVIAQSNNEVYIFSYFKNNGEDGLHLAYSKDAYHWTALNNDQSFLKPAAGKDQLMRDPCIIRGGDNKFHMVWTVSWDEKGIGYASSQDLVHWSKQQFIPLMENENALNCWAPEINYDAATKQYMIYWATTIPGKFADTDSTGDDNKYNHRLYYVLTKDFKKFSKPALLYNKGFNVIDATIKKDKGRYIMFMKDETKFPVAQKNIRTATSKYLNKNYSSASAPITGNYWAEGPTVIKKDSTWIVYFDKYTEGKYGAVESTGLENWKDISDAIRLPEGIRHGTIFTVTKKEFESVLSPFIKK